MGRRMVQLLLARMRGDDEPDHVLLDTHLVKRVSG
jgi:DNA-binding LacI/PurR family transcriptional regulator